ncbi:TPA: hypothetical protein IAA92_08550 [Candidatus Galligastranaerophilus intestinigallinarum]|nr:hypothetical protein [Candidatus Galligastranaerophilus intestinigallinarum]
MINQIFKNTFVYNYFSILLNSNKRFPQSIIFEGFDTIMQYFFSLELARILNCTGDKTPSCSCTNCNWIRENRHPAVVNVTPVDFKEDGTKTVISVKQIEKVTSLILETSDYHRFFIFSNVKTSKIQENEQKQLSKYLNAGFKINKEDWLPAPINKKILQEEASNALLKSTEEAPNKVTFVFLANSREDIISTIVSRSLVFKTPVSIEKSQINVSSFFKNYPDLPISDAMKTSTEILSYIEENGLSHIEFLDSAEEFFVNLLRQNAKNNQIFNLISSDIKKVQLAKKHLAATITPNNTFENLFISISNEGRNL